MREPRNTEELEVMTEKLVDRFREKSAIESQGLAEIVMGLIAHVHRLEKVLQVTGHPDRPKAAALTIDRSSITISPTSIGVKSDDFVLLGSHNLLLRADGKCTIRAAGHLTLNGSRISQTGDTAVIDGGSELQLKGQKILETGQDSVHIKANNVDIIAAGDITLKGSKIREN